MAKRKSGRWLIKEGACIGTFVVGHLARVKDYPNDAIIVGVAQEGELIRLVLHFDDPQQTTVGLRTNSRVMVSSSAIVTTWRNMASVKPHLAAGLPEVREFGTAPDFVPPGYILTTEVRGTVEQVRNRFKGKYVVLVKSAELEGQPGIFKFGLFEFDPQYTRWRHGGWYVSNVDYPSGAIGCVSNNYPDKRWRIVCDDRLYELNEPGDFTYPSRDAAARAELERINYLKAIKK